MTDDEIAASLELVAARLRKRPPQAGWIGQFRRGEVLTTARAAHGTAAAAYSVSP